MKTLDFTQPGRMPVTQDVLNYLQTAYKEQIGLLAQLAGSNQTNIPVIVAGLVNHGNVLDAGWFVYNGEIIYTTGGTLLSPPAGQEFAISITTTSVPLGLLYGDGSNPNVKNDKIGTLVTQNTSTPNTATQFAVTQLVSFGSQLGKTNRDAAWPSVALSKNDTYGIVSGTLYYKKNYIANTLQIRGSVSVQVGTSTSINTYFTVGTLPTGFMPNNMVPFSLYYHYQDPGKKEQYGTDYLRQMNGEILTDGSISLGLIFPDSGAVTYTFNTIIPLD